MNTFSDILARVPFLSIRFVVSIPPHKVIEQLKNVISAQEPIDSETQDFFYNADFEDHTFLIQIAYIKRFKEKVLVPKREISYWCAYNPVSMDQTPIFYGRVLRHGYGDESIIKGHFGIGTPYYLLLISIALMVFVILLNEDIQYIIPIVALFFFRALLSIYQFINERKQIKTFLYAVFNNARHANDDYK